MTTTTNMSGSSSSLFYPECWNWLLSVCSVTTLASSNSVPLEDHQFVVVEIPTKMDEGSKPPQQTVQLSVKRIFEVCSHKTHGNNKNSTFTHNNDDDDVQVADIMDCSIYPPSSQEPSSPEGCRAAILGLLYASLRYQVNSDSSSDVTSSSATNIPLSHSRHTVLGQQESGLYNTAKVPRRVLIIFPGNYKETSKTDAGTVASSLGMLHPMLDIIGMLCQAGVAYAVRETVNAWFTFLVCRFNFLNINLKTKLLKVYLPWYIQIMSVPINSSQDNRKLAHLGISPQEHLPTLPISASLATQSAGSVNSDEGINGGVEFIISRLLSQLPVSTFSKESEESIPLIVLFCDAFLSQSPAWSWLVSQSKSIVRSEYENTTAFPKSHNSSVDPLLSEANALRVLLPVIIFHRVLSWCTVDALSPESLLGIAPPGLSLAAVHARRSAMRLLNEIWNYAARSEAGHPDCSVTENLMADCDRDDMKFVFRKPICLILGREFVFSLGRIGRVAEVQSIVSFLASPTPLSWLEILSKREDATRSRLEMGVGASLEMEAETLAERDKHILRWLDHRLLAKQVQPVLQHSLGLRLLDGPDNQQTFSAGEGRANAVKRCARRPVVLLTLLGQRPCTLITLSAVDHSSVQILKFLCDDVSELRKFKNGCSRVHPLETNDRTRCTTSLESGANLRVSRAGATVENRHFTTLITGYNNDLFPSLGAIDRETAITARSTDVAHSIPTWDNDLFDSRPPTSDAKTSGTRGLGVLEVFKQLLLALQFHPPGASSVTVFSTALQAAVSDCCFDHLPLLDLLPIEPPSMSAVQQKTAGGNSTVRGDLKVRADGSATPSINAELRPVLLQDGTKPTLEGRRQEDESVLPTVQLSTGNDTLILAEEMNVIVSPSFPENAGKGLAQCVSIEDSDDAVATGNQNATCQSSSYPVNCSSPRLVIPRESVVASSHKQLFVPKAALLRIVQRVVSSDRSRATILTQDPEQKYVPNILTDLLSHLIGQISNNRRTPAPIQQNSPCRNSTSSALMSPLLVSLLYFLSLFIEEWNQILSAPEGGGDLTHKGCVCPSGIASSSLALTFLEHSIAQLRMADLLPCVPVTAFLQRDSFGQRALGQQVHPAITAYYSALCRHTLVGKLVLLCGVEPQTLWVRKTVDTVGGGNCDVDNIISQEKCGWWPETLEARRGLPLPVAGPMILEEELHVHIPPFSERDVPVKQELLKVLQEVFDVLFFNLPTLWPRDRLTSALRAAKETRE